MGDLCLRAIITGYVSDAELPLVSQNQPQTQSDAASAVNHAPVLKAWERLETETKDAVISAADRKNEHINAQIILVQAQITRLENLEQNDGRDKLIRNLKKQLSELKYMK